MRSEVSKVLNYFSWSGRHWLTTKAANSLVKLLRSSRRSSHS